MAASSKARRKSSGPALLPVEHHQGKPPIALVRPIWVIGSRSNARLHLLSNTVSKAHALLVNSSGRFYIRDLASRSKVFINGEEIREADLTDGDVIKIGSFTFKYIAGPGERPTAPPVEPPPAKLQVTGAEYPVPIDQRVMLIGRRPACDIHLLEESVSTAHAVIFEMDGSWYIRDLGSRTGTFINGVSTHQHRLNPGDAIHIGDTDLKFLLNEVAPAVVVDDRSHTGDLVSLADLTAEEPEAVAADLAIPLEEQEPEIPAAIPAEASPAPMVDLASEPLVDEIPAQTTAEIPPLPDAVPEPLPQARSEAPADLELKSPLGGKIEESKAPSPEMELRPDVAEVEEVSTDESKAELELSTGTVVPLSQVPVVEEPEAAIIEESAALPPPPKIVESKEELKLPSGTIVPLEAIPVVEEPQATIIEKSAPPPLPVPEIVESKAELKLPTGTIVPLEKVPVIEEPAASTLPLSDADEIEVLSATEPTPDSALDAADALAIDALSAPAEALTVDPLSDTGLDREMRELSGEEGGEIIEPETDETAAKKPPKSRKRKNKTDAIKVVRPESPVAEEKLEPVAEAPKVEAQAPEAPASPPLVPWDANPDNFVGGVPVQEPPKAPMVSSGAGEEAVKELIDEIDTVAAAAEAAAAAPSEHDPSTILPSIPPRRRQPNVFRSPRKSRDAADSTNDKPEEIGELHTGFDGLAIPPVREMDVFSHMSPPAVDLEFPAENGKEEEVEESVDEPAFESPRGTVISQEKPESELPPLRAVVPELNGPVEGEVIRNVEIAPPAVEKTEAEIAAIRKRYFRRVSGLVAAMSILIALAGFGIYNFLGVRSTVEASITFKNLGALTQLERNRFQAEQVKLLKEDTTRRVARQKLNEKNPEISPGFLDEQLDYFKTAELATFRDSKPEQMVITVYGKDASVDAPRAAAMATAMYEVNAQLRDQARQQRQSLDELNKKIDQYQKQLTAMNSDIESLRISGENSPGPEQISQLDAQVAALEKTWNDSVAAVKAAQAELDRIKIAPAGESDAVAASSPSADDDKIKAMQSQLNDLQGKINAAKAASSEQATNAKKSLDAAIDGFAKQVADAQGMMNGNPEIASFVDAAQKLQQTTRQLTDDLIRRQEQQFGRLTELRERLNDKMEQRRVELWQSDKELQDLTERLAITTRQYNAAVGGGLKEADDLKAQVELTKSMIKARQDLLPGDTFYADAIQQLQVIIDSTKKNIDEDRAKTEQLLTSLQQSFTSKETIEKLPQEQKDLAAALQKQLAEINAARQQYNEAADAGAADADAQIKTQITTLQAGIEARRKQIADDNLKQLKDQQDHQRLAMIETKQAELQKLTDAETNAKQAYFAKHKEWRDAQSLSDDAKANEDKRNGLILQKGIVERSHTACVAQVEIKQLEVNRAVEPIMPGDNDITINRGEDRRLAYTLISGGLILVIFTGLILWTLHTAAIEAPFSFHHTAEIGDLGKSDPQGMPMPLNPPKEGGNEEDHQPLAI
jgi:pSer/pThr/pTyr-binding forkhead associated (FHA) protein